MALLDSEVDAQFFNLVHQLSAPREGAERNERRVSLRYPFGSMQRIAPYVGPSIPDTSDFFEVQCHDLTQQGFSFLLPEPPAYRRLVAAFGPVEDAIHAAANVVDVTKVMASPTGPVHKTAETMPQRLLPNEEASIDVCTVDDRDGPMGDGPMGDGEDRANVVSTAGIGNAGSNNAAFREAVPMFLVHCEFTRRLHQY